MAKPQRKTMCATCIYNTPTGKRLWRKALSHSCHEMADNRAYCAGAKVSAPQEKLLSTKEEAQEWKGLIRGMGKQSRDEITQIVFRNRSMEI